jgi:hypothetical protein
LTHGLSELAEDIGEAAAATLLRLTALGLAHGLTELAENVGQSAALT